jgi:hydroxymethylglutaryl-CoA synthase
MRVGIDAVAVAVPESYLELADLARARSVPEAKYLEGLGVQRMSIAGPHEDPVALAANAAGRLFATSGAASRIGLCVVGTETAVDHSKPVAAFLHRLLGLPQRCRVYETKHACCGGTAGVLTAVDWIASGSARGQSAHVVCTDIARYELGSAGEPTQGAGAVALLLSESPRLLELEPGASGSFSRDVDDFWRPLHRKEALVDRQLSVQCYLDALAGAYEAFREVAPGAQLSRRCYHVPYGKMARKAHRHVLALEGRGEAEADASFAQEVAPSLRLPAQVGNIYTGSLWLSLASLLEAEAATLEGQRIGLFSYGSGCTAEFFAGTLRGRCMARPRAGLLSTREMRWKCAATREVGVR